MRLNNSWMVVTIPLLALACGPTTGDGFPETALAQQAAEEVSGTTVTNKVLILSTTVYGGLSSQEAIAAQNLGMQVDVVTSTTWSTKTAADFASYRALILGDARCASLSAINAAIANRNVWGPLIDGNVIVVGTAPVLHTGTSTLPGPLTRDAVAFALAQPDKTGAYINLSCYYAAVPTPTLPPGQLINVLDQFGTFSALRPSGCYNSAHIVANLLSSPSITDANLSNWGSGTSCSAKEVFDTFPSADFAPVVIQRDPPTGPPYPGSMLMPDGSHGPVYVVAKGARPLMCGDGVINGAGVEQCDDGALNGVPGHPCSGTCRLHWCGDGVLDPDEQCDLGPDNGKAGACSALCRGIVEHNPVARCRAATTLPTPPDSCGVSLSIDNGSFDPDGGPLTCTQSPPGPYNPGITTVTLTCRNSSGLTSTCSTGVMVVDDVPPRMTCPDDIQAECVHGGAAHVILPPPPVLEENCGTVSITGPGSRNFPFGTTEVQYTATDGSLNATQCTATAPDSSTVVRPIRVTVADTLEPTLTLLGGDTINLLCDPAGTPWMDPGAKAADACSDDLTSRIRTSGSVDTANPGAYKVSYEVTDDAGLTAQKIRTVIVTCDTPIGK